METTNQSNATSVISSDDNKSVEILFGLNPNQLYFSVGQFFEFPRMCSVALMEMLEAIQKRNEKDEDVSILIDFTKTMRILVDLERLSPVYGNFIAVFNDSGYKADWLDQLTGTSEGTAAHDIIMTLHYELLNIVNAVDKIGFMEFSANVYGSISEVTTKQAYEDMVCALSCIYTIYIAYIKSRYSCQAQKCVVKSKNQTT